MPHFRSAPDTAMTRSRNVSEEIGTHSSPSRCNMTCGCWRSTTAKKTSLSVRRLIAKKKRAQKRMYWFAQPLSKPSRKFDRSERRCYDDSAGWSSLVARWAHNPKVGGSNPPPATTYKFRQPKKTQNNSGCPKVSWKPGRGCEPFGSCHSQCHSCYPAVGFALRVHQRVAVDVHGGRDLSVPHQLLLHA